MRRKQNKRDAAVGSVPFSLLKMWRRGRHTFFLIYYFLFIIYYLVYHSPTHAQFLSSRFRTSHPVSVTKTRSSMRTPNSPGR